MNDVVRFKLREVYGGKATFRQVDGAGVDLSYGHNFVMYYHTWSNKGMPTEIVMSVVSE